MHSFVENSIIIQVSYICYLLDFCYAGGLGKVFDQNAVSNDGFL